MIPFASFTLDFRIQVPVSSSTSNQVVNREELIRLIERPLKIHRLVFADEDIQSYAIDAVSIGVGVAIA